MKRRPSISVSARTAELLKAAAERDGKSMAQIVEEALADLPCHGCGRAVQR